MDWAANAPHGVPCLYRYHTPGEWHEMHRRHNLHVEREVSSMRLYPPMYNWFFGNRLQYFAVLRPGGGPGANGQSQHTPAPAGREHPADE